MGNGSVAVSNDSHDHRLIALVQRIITERSIPNVAPIHKEQKLLDFGLTSLDLARLVLLVEDEFDFRIPVRDLVPANFRSIATISQLISKLVVAQK
jgi:acyl carrier protein